MADFVRTISLTPHSQTHLKYDDNSINNFNIVYKKTATENFSCGCFFVFCFFVVAVFLLFFVLFCLFLVYGYLNGVAYPNNSIVDLSEIGLDDNSLVCYTDLITCCRGEDSPIGGALGDWRLPINSAAISKGISNANMFSRNRNKQALLLHRGINVSEPSGIFICDIPDANMQDQQAYFGIYKMGEGMSLNMLGN